MSSISRIAGQMLQANLIRDGNSLAFANTGNSTSTLYIDVANSRVGINSNVANVTLDVVGNIAGGNLSITGLVSVTGNATAGNVLTGGRVSATGNIEGGNLLAGNIVIPATGNVDLGNVNINNLAAPYANSDAVTKFYVDTQIGNIGTLGNLTIANTTISTTLANGNITLTSTGNQLVQISGTAGIIIPAGNTAQRPGSAVTSTLRVNTQLEQLEYYSGSAWVSAAGAAITNQTLNGDGSNTVFTLDTSTTTAAALIMLNGVVQIPTTAYSVSTTTLTFTEAPASGDVIDVRFLG